MRYSRQELFAPIGRAGQARIRAARVLVAGCGGLGSNAAALLARAGAVEVVVDEAEPSLEDVFLAVVGRGGKAAEGAP